MLLISAGFVTYELVTYRMMQKLHAQGVAHAEVYISAGVVHWRGQEFAPLFEGAERALRQAQLFRRAVDFGRLFEKSLLEPLVYNVAILVVIEAENGFANHQAEPLVSQERDSTRRSRAPAVRIAIAGYSGST